MNRVHSRLRGRHINPFQVLLIGLALGWMTAAFLVIAWLLVIILAYGLFGAGINPPSLRVAAFVFSAVFVTVTVVGSGSWAADKVRTFLQSKDTTHDR